MPHKWLCSISWHLFLNSMKTPAQRMLCVLFFLQISVVPQLFETCCVFEFLKLPPVMKITLIACLWNIQSETEYTVTITNRWRLTFYIPCYSISSFLWLLVRFCFFALKPENPLKFCGSQLHYAPKGLHHGQRKGLFPFKQHSTTVHWAPIMCQTQE